MGVYPETHDKGIWVLLKPSDERYYLQSDHTNTSYKRNEEWQVITRFGGYQGEAYDYAIIYEYRFFMIDLTLIMRQNERLHHQFVQIEAQRALMYQQVIDRLIGAKCMHAPRQGSSHQPLLKHIRIISDFWGSSSEIYHTESPAERIRHYAGLLLQLFYPYLTAKGQQAFDQLMEEFGRQIITGFDRV